MEYRTIFKCRLCGETYESGCTGNENIAFSAAISACLGIPSKDPFFNENEGGGNESENHRR